jgi:hypothetical protein
MFLARLEGSMLHRHIATTDDVVQKLYLNVYIYAQRPRPFVLSVMVPGRIHEQLRRAADGREQWGEAEHGCAQRPGTSLRIKNAKTNVKIKNERHTFDE